MEIVERLKKVTPKQWAMYAVGGTGAVLLGNYLYVDDKNKSLVMKLWHSLQGAAPPPPPAPQVAPQLPAHRPHVHHRPAMLPQRIAPPAPVMMQPEVIVEPYAQPYFTPRYPYGYPRHFARAAAPFFERPYGYGHPGFAHPFAQPHSHIPIGHPHHYVTGADASSAPPMAPPPTRTAVPPPGARGIAGTIPPPDPSQHAPLHPAAAAAAGDFAGAAVPQEPCPPGLMFNAATGTCVPYPSTPPFAAGHYEWE